MEPSEDFLLVAPGIGRYRNIQEAVNAASPGSRIVVCPGLYTRSVEIKKPGLTLEAKETNGEVQLSTSKGPLISVSLETKETCTIKGFKLIHKAPERLVSDKHWLEELSYDQDMDCGVWVENGSVTLEDCQISLGTIKNPMPGVLISNGEVFLNYCEIKGTHNVASIGILCEDANLNMHSCKVHKHKDSGVVLKNQTESSICIAQCIIADNLNYGVLCDTPESVPVLQHNKIMQNQRAGIIVTKGNQAKVKENEIKYNEVGVQAIDSSPVLIKNKIRCNFGNGVEVTTDVGGAFVKISGNQIYENENGITVKGDMCKALIENNSFIGNNRKSGIMVDNSAQAEIRGNEILENVWQGILLVTDTSAVIEKNRIYGNLRANIAGGRGPLSISENRIYKGRCEGVFLFEPNDCKIYSNEIYENNDGILAVDGTTEVLGNSIHDNKRTGATFAGGKEPKKDNEGNLYERVEASVLLEDNEVYRNTEVGINIRDWVKGQIKGNRAFENPIQICILSQAQFDISSIKKNNEWTGEVQLPLPNYCEIV